MLEFNSTRKRMSVIVEDERGTIKLYCKGADSVIFERLAPKQPFKEATTQHLKDFASDGLRTLCLGVAQLSREKYEEWAAVRCGPSPSASLVRACFSSFRHLFGEHITFQRHPIFSTKAHRFANTSFFFPRPPPLRIKIYNEASTALVNRGQQIDQAAELIERNLFLLGASAIEDRLQDGVPETIRSLAGLLALAAEGRVAPAAPLAPQLSLCFCGGRK